MTKPRILFLWARYSGYMAACWKQLAALGFDVRVVAIASKPSDASDPHFDPQILDGLPTTLIPSTKANDWRHLEATLPSEKPDCVVMSGWQFRGYVKAVRNNLFGDAPLVLCSDNPIRHDWRQKLGAHLLRGLLDRCDRVLVPGESGFQLMKSWRVAPEKIVKGLYGVDETALLPCLESRRKKGWPKNFIFTGRFCERKGVDLLLEAYGRYRTQTENSWGLICCGRGELQSSVSSQPGVINAGFVQPHDLPAQLSSSSCFVLASRSDAWPLSLVEAALSGLPIICSSACGSAAELTRDLYSGRVVPPNQVDPLAAALGWMHERTDELDTMGQRSQALALPYTSSQWAKRWQHVLKDLNVHSHVS